MINIAIVEDEERYANTLQNYISKYETESNEKFSVEVFTDGIFLLESFKGQFDIILLDIEMKHIDGMTTAEKIRALDHEVVIIFITNMTQYAIRGYSVDALDYVVKPVAYFAFTERLKRAISRMKRREDRFLTIVFRGGARKIRINDIYYIEVQDHDIIYHTANGDFTVSGSLISVESKLKDDGFFRCNKCYLINLNHVEGMKDGCAIVAGVPVTISRSKKRDFLYILSSYMRKTKK